MEISLAALRYVLVAIKELALARISHATRPSSAILRELQSAPLRPQLNLWDDKKNGELQRIAWAISAAASRVPWRSDCLLQVMAANRWLRRIGIHPQFNLGVSKDRFGQFKAHAWLTCNDVKIPKAPIDEYAIILRSGDDEPSATARKWL